MTCVLVGIGGREGSLSLSRTSMMSRHHENYAQQRRQLRRVQKQRRSAFLHNAAERGRTNQSNSKQFRKFKKNLRLQYLNSPRATRQSKSIQQQHLPFVRASTSMDVNLDAAKKKSDTILEPPPAATTTAPSTPQPQGIVTRQHHKRLLEKALPMPQRRQSTRLHDEEPLNEPMRQRRSMMEPEITSRSSSEDEYGYDDASSTTPPCTARQTIGGTPAPRRMLRSSLLQAPLRRDKAQRADQAIVAGQTNTMRRRGTQHNPQKPCTDIRPTTTIILNEPDNEGPRVARRTNRRTCESPSKPPHEETTFDVNYGFTRRSIRLFLQEPIVRPQQKQPQEQTGSDNSEKTFKPCQNKAVAVVAETDEPIGRPMTRYASKRQLFAKTNHETDSVEIALEAAPVSSRCRSRKTHPKTLRDDACPQRSNQKRKRNETVVSLRRSCRIKIHETNSCHETIENSDQSQPHAVAANNVKDHHPSPPKKSSRQVQSTNVGSSGGFILDHVQLTAEYEASASSGKVKHVRFGPTIESAQAAVERTIRLFERRASVVDQDILADEKQHRKSLKTHSSFEVQERMNILEDVVEYEEGAVLKAEDASNVMKELADTPILSSDQLSIRSRSSQCKDCALCRQYTQAAGRSMLTGTTITPCIDTVNGFELEDSILKNTLNALKRLRFSLEFVKEQNELTTVA